MAEPAPHCPVPLSRYPTVLLAHGGGGRLMRQLIDEIFAPALADVGLDATHDAATLAMPPGGRLAFTTDSFVVRPLEFPGGDIGTLAVYGTVNDLAMAGAKPLALSLAVVIEEGLPTATLARIASSVATAARDAGVRIATGDTKVIERQRTGDNLILTTSGVGVVPDGVALGPHRIAPGDIVLLNGDIARHGMAVMAARDGTGFEAVLDSDCAPLHRAVHDLLAAGEVHALRDCTRGGVATALHELATAAGVTIELDESAIAVREDVRAACELTGIDPLYVANEGRFVAIVPAATADAALVALRRASPWPGVVVAGRVRERATVPLQLRTPWGTTRVLDLLSGEQLPRIC